jgi:bifunctional DNA-binding transcriptional regulator/antitoxin component of YhaV-PrlF toxin-antitoxin module
MNMPVRRAGAAVMILPLLVLSTAGCDIVTADLKHTETAEWRKTYNLQPGGRVEVSNINGQIQVEPSNGNSVEVVALKTAKGHSPEDARQALARVEIVEQSGPAGVRIETKVQRTHGWFDSGANVRYTVRVPSGAQSKFSTTNGGVELRGVSGSIEVRTTNGGITAREVTGSIEASTTNGGLDVDLVELDERGARLECTNGGIKLRLPSNAKASISANVTNGGIDTGGLPLETVESTRRRLEARLNGGGPQIRLECTNGGLSIRAR